MESFHIRIASRNGTVAAPACPTVCARTGENSDGCIDSSEVSGDEFHHGDLQRSMRREDRTSTAEALSKPSPATLEFETLRASNRASSESCRLRSCSEESGSPHSSQLEPSRAKPSRARWRPQCTVHSSCLRIERTHFWPFAGACALDLSAVHVFRSGLWLFSIVIVSRLVTVAKQRKSGAKSILTHSVLE